MLEMAPAFAERVRAAKREERFVGTAVASYFRRPYGPGWALVGDAGYNRDFITAQGMHDAFRDAELCAAALDEAFSGVHGNQGAMDAFARMMAGVTSPAEFFSEQNVGRILANA
jgi:flavin-dependent dehydrogenase